MDGTHIEVRELSAAVQKALKSVAHGAKDIQVIPAESVEAMVAGGDGMRGFVLVLNLDTGASRTVSGSWGGSNMFNRSNLIDSTDEVIPIPENGAVIKGTRGYPRTFATIYAHPVAMGKFLPSGETVEELTDEEQQALYCFAAIKGGAYRVGELNYRRVSQGTVDGLVERGYLKKNKAGATQITTKGKNARTVRN